MALWSWVADRRGGGPGRWWHIEAAASVSLAAAVTWGLAVALHVDRVAAWRSVWPASSSTRLVRLRAMRGLNWQLRRGSSHVFVALLGLRCVDGGSPRMCGFLVGFP
jgi:hypothetical protein